MNAFEAFAAKIAEAVSTDEPDIFAEAASLFRTDTHAVEYFRTRAFADAAIRIHRTLFPGNGYQLGETAARRGFASTWRRGDPHAHSLEAATPALALLRASVHEAAWRARADKRANCSRCTGLGWTITRDGGKRICGHTEF